MPLTFIDIERQKNWRIAIFFVALMVIYVVMGIVLVSAVFPFPLEAPPRLWATVIAASVLIAAIHFWFSSSDAVDTVVRTLNARPPDPNDGVHNTLMNIMHEIHVVTGNRRHIRSAVIPSLSMNALAVADLRGNALIGITEGLLARLTRPQLEAVVAHEAHHILSGDCLETTVAASLFGTYSAALEKLGRATRGRAFASPAPVVAWLLLRLSHLLQMFISREREYRADAASVRMTRNPVALAETLFSLSRSWRGAGFIGSGLEMLCIVNPRASSLDESEGFFSDLLSTHPPLKKRIDVMLKMARVSIAELHARSEKRDPPQLLPEEPAGPSYYAMNPKQEWQGPFSFAEFAVLPWLSPLTWISAGTGTDQAVDRAWQHPELTTLFHARLSATEQVSSDAACPSCAQPLVVRNFERTQIRQCSFCGGMLIENQKIARILARAPRSCSERVQALAQATLNHHQFNRVARNRQENSPRKPGVPLLACPKCANPMSRGFYSYAHLVEVDRCSFCNHTWFDQDELEMLQCIIQNRMKPEINLPTMEERA